MTGSHEVTGSSPVFSTKTSSQVNRFVYLLFLFMIVFRNSFAFGVAARK